MELTKLLDLKPRFIRANEFGLINTNLVHPTKIFFSYRPNADNKTNLFNQLTYLSGQKKNHSKFLLDPVSAVQKSEKLIINYNLIGVG